MPLKENHLTPLKDNDKTYIWDNKSQKENNLTDRKNAASRNDDYTQDITISMIFEHNKITVSSFNYE